MINRAVLTGRLTRDPELRYTTSGTAVVSFTLAVDRQFRNQNGDRDADFINCVIWRKSAENFSNFTHKGSLVGIEGRITKINKETEFMLPKLLSIILHCLNHAKMVVVNNMAINNHLVVKVNHSTIIINRNLEIMLLNLIRLMALVVIVTNQVNQIINSLMMGMMVNPLIYLMTNYHSKEFFNQIGG